mmetsp:Transcript_57802/g.159532  ORF Transcript_57802/g.159532 Transcript_57802/m.159532 type:complete len:440 (-) Transcript_57802:57-1376(-)
MGGAVHTEKIQIPIAYLRPVTHAHSLTHARTMAALEEETADGKKPWTSDGAALEDSNVANIGSEEDKAARKAAAEGEEAWVGCGGEPGVEVWRIEQFQVVKWPKDEYGKFYKGDSYICLKTTKDPEGDKLSHDIHFWLGESTSTDEMGTAAYKTVELDDLMDGEPTQHREVMSHESHEFTDMFERIDYLEGGVESGFHHVEPDAYMPRLLEIRKVKRTIKVKQVPMTHASLNEGDSYILDAGTKIFVFCGADSSAFEKNKANSAAENMENERQGRSEVSHVSMDEETPDSELFWTLLGGKNKIKTAAEGDAYEPEEIGEGIMFKLSDDSGSLLCTEVARGDLTIDMLVTSDVFLIDTTLEVFVWVGEQASEYEKRQAMNTAVKYLEQNDRPMHTPITVFKEGKPIVNEIWNSIFSDGAAAPSAVAPAAAAAEEEEEEEG